MAITSEHPAWETLRNIYVANGCGERFFDGQTHWVAFQAGDSVAFAPANQGFDFESAYASTMRQPSGHVERMQDTQAGNEATVQEQARKSKRARTTKKK